MPIVSLKKSEFTSVSSVNCCSLDGEAHRLLYCRCGTVQTVFGWFGKEFVQEDFCKELVQVLVLVQELDFLKNLYKN